MSVAHRMDHYLAQLVVDLMNEAVALDRRAIDALIGYRVPCNEALAEHPTIQCGKDDGELRVGLLGILNGLCGVQPNEFGLVAAVLDDNGKLVNFTVLK